MIYGSINPAEAIYMTLELLRHVVHLGPEIAGGYLAYLTHGARHRLYHALAHVIRRAAR
jgi:hypothetical protein